MLQKVYIQTEEKEGANRTMQVQPNTSWRGRGRGRDLIESENSNMFVILFVYAILIGLNLAWMAIDSTLRNDEMLARMAGAAIPTVGFDMVFEAEEDADEAIAQWFATQNTQVAA